MAQTLINIKIITIFIIFLYLSNYTICLKNSWNYINCKKYLNTIDILCTKIIKNKILNICEKWELVNSSSNANIPTKCLNKKYILSLWDNNNSDMKVKKYYIINFSEKENKEILNNNIDDDINECLKIIDYFEEFNSMDLCGDDIEKEMKEWRKKLKITHFCINLLNIIINKMKKVYSLNEQKEIINYSYKDILKLILKEDYEFDDVDVDESNLENSENDDEMNCREN